MTKVVHSKEGITVENPLPKFKTGSLHPEWPYITFTYQSERRGGKETVELLVNGRGEQIARQKTADGQVFDYPVYIGEKDYIIMKYNLPGARYYIKLHLNGSSQWTAGENMYKNGWMTWANNGTWSGTRGLQANPPYVQPKTCFSVDSRQGWQSFTANHRVSGVNYIEGGWSVDARSYSMVSYTGHQGAGAERLAPFNAYKYNQGFPFGALLMQLPNGKVIWANKPGSELGSFPDGSTFRFRINDADEALSDNGGSLKVCLVYGVG